MLKITFINYVLSILGTTTFSTIISHFLNVRSIRKELRFRREDSIARKIDDSLIAIRNMELKLKNQEIFNIDKELNIRGSDVNMFGGECIYPEIFNDCKSYSDFYKEIYNCREKHEKYLPCTIALNLVFLDRYISQLLLFMKEFKGEKYLPIMGTIFIFDLQKWQRKIDKILVKKINNHNYKIESHETLKWRLLRVIIIEYQYKNTILYALLNEKYPKKNKKKLKVIKSFLTQLKNEK